VKTTEGIMEILAAYDLTGSYRDAAALAGCSHHTVARSVLARDAGELRTSPSERSQLIDPFRDKMEEWVDASRGHVRADVVQRKLEVMGYVGSERTTRRAVAEAKANYAAGHRRRFRPWLPEPGLWFQWDYADGSRVSPVLVAPRCTGIPSSKRDTSGEQLGAAVRGRPHWPGC